MCVSGGNISEVLNFSANQRQGRPSCFSDRLENTNLLVGVEILLPVKSRWIPFSRFRVHTSNNVISQSEIRMSAILFFRSARKCFHIHGTGRWDLCCPVKFRWMTLSAVSEKSVWKCPRSVIGKGGHLVFSHRPEKHIFDYTALRSSVSGKVRWIPLSGFRPHQVGNDSVNQ